MATGAVAGAAAGSIIGGVLAGKSSKESLAQQQAFMDRAYAEFEKIGVPQEEAMQYVLENPKLVFDYFPKLEQEFPKVKSEMEAIEVDPRLKQAQTQALSGLEERASMGLTPEESAQLDALRRETSGAETGRQAGILQNMEQRGLGGAGAELQARLASSQASTQRAAEESDRLASMQFQAKQEALSRLGQTAGEMRGQEFGEQAQQASAMDAIAQFNAAQQAAVQQRNVGSMNQAELEKQRIAQDIEGQRAAARQAEEMQRVQAKKDKFGMDIDKASGMTAQISGMAKAAGDAGTAKAKGTADLYGGLGKAAGAAFDIYNKDKK